MAGARANNPATSFIGSQLNSQQNYPFSANEPANMLSRVSAYAHLGSIALAPLGIVLFGLLYESGGHQLTLTVAALVVIVPTLLVFTVQDVRRMTIDYETSAERRESAAKPTDLLPTTTDP